MQNEKKQNKSGHGCDHHSCFNDSYRNDSDHCLWCQSCRCLCTLFQRNLLVQRLDLLKFL